MDVIKKIDITPGVDMVDVFANSGYTLETAIADIIDNSIDAKAKNVWLEFNYAGLNSTISIIDDGNGMSIEELISAATIAPDSINKQRNNGALGKYGCGMKFASLSFAQKLIIQSIKKELNSILIDFPQIVSSKSWNASLVSNMHNYIKTTTGTAIIWNDIKFMSDGMSQRMFYDKLSKVEEHLNHVFCNFILENSINIFVNGNKLSGWDPFFKHSKTTRIYEDTIMYHNKFIKVEVYTLPTFNSLTPTEQVYLKGKGMNEQQGFYIYRNNRLIQEGGWLSIDKLTASNKYDYARIKIELTQELDDFFNPDFKKSTISLPDDLIADFKKIAKKAREASHKNFNYMRNPKIAKTIKTTDNIPLWNTKKTNKGVLVSINENNPVLQELCKDLSISTRKKLFSAISNSIPYLEIQQRDFTNELSKEEYLDLADEFYDSMIEKGIAKEEILKKFCAEPFSLNKEWLFEYLNDKELV